jgi:hypothetical protein
MTTGTYPQRNVSPWADLSTMQATWLTALWLRAGLELDLSASSSSLPTDADWEAFTWWFLVRSATEATHHDRWCIIE